MKKNILIVALVLLGLHFTSSAARVSVQAARTVALNFYKLNATTAGNKSLLTANLTYTRTEADDTTDFYVFGIGNGTGFVIVAADDNVQPVLAYSTESNFTADVNMTGVKDWMDHAAKHIYTAIQQNIPADLKIATAWRSYTAGQNPGVAKSGTVGPLVASKWNQEPYYNALCPFNSTDQQRTVTGCVATTMAQIMRYWQYPLHGVGAHTYNNWEYGDQSADFGATTYSWSAMPLTLTGANGAVALAMYHCGVSVDMGYGDMNEGGSGAQVMDWGGGASAEMAFKTYFSYDPNTLQGVYQSDYNATDWMNMMKAEINAGRPVQYVGSDATAGGHTWVCDGYDGNSMLHMNWGWGGGSDGYFTVNSLTGGGYNFNNDESALIGIQPIRASVVASATKTHLCTGESSFLSADGDANATYSWTPTTGLSCAGCAFTNASPAVTTTYTVKIDSLGFTGSSTITVTVTPQVTIASSVVTNATCYGANDGAVSITTTGGTPTYTYAWSNGLTTVSAADLTAGTYLVTVTDAAGCSATSIKTVSQPAAITVSAATTNAGCTSATGSAVATVTSGAIGSVTYTWNTGVSSNSINAVAAGTYTLTVTDSHNCSTVSDVVIEQPYQIQVTTTATNAATNQNNGTAAVDAVNEGSAPYTYVWSNGATTQNISGLAPGTYTVTVADNSGCYQTATTVVNAVTATGIANANDNLLFSVYPNPAKNNALVQLSQLNSESTLTLNNILGQTVYTSPVTALQTQIDLSSFSNGVYFVVLRSGDKKLVKELVVNK